MSYSRLYLQQYAGKKRMNQAVYTVKGMHCASCASIIERKLKKLPNVEQADVSYATESLTVSPALPLETLNAEIIPLGYRIEPEAASHETAPDIHKHHGNGDNQELIT